MSNCPFDVNPYSQSRDNKAKSFPNINYANQDFWSLKTRLIEFIRERFGENGTEIPNTFNDFVESSIAIMLIENWAFIGDMLSFKMDQIVNELFIDTLTETENAFRLAKLVGFKPQPPVPSRSFWIASLNNPQITDLIIPTPIIIALPSQTDNNSRIELFPANSNNEPLFDQDIIIPAGSTINKTIIGVEGVSVRQETAGTGEVAQTITLSQFPVIYDSITVEVDGNIWDNVDFFTDSQPRMEHRVEFNSLYQGFVMFGNNRTGMIPSNGSKIVITYRIGGGVAGNIVTGAIEYQNQVSVPGLNYPIPITYRNYTKGEFGYEGDKIEDIRRKLPKWIKTQNRAVSPEDFKTLSEQFVTPFHGQIGKAKAVLRNHGCSGNIVDLYILANDSGELIIANDNLKSGLRDELNSKKMLTDYVCIKNGVVLKTDVNIDLTLDRFNRKFEKEIRENVERTIDVFFNLNNWDFGEILKDTDIIKNLSSLKEIISFQITFVTENGDSGQIVSPKYYEIVRPDNINISFTYE